MLGQILRVERTKRGWTQAEAASFFGVAQNTVCNWERGNRIPSIRQLRKVAAVLGCSVSDFVRDEAETKEGAEK